MNSAKVKQIWFIQTFVKNWIDPSVKPNFHTNQSIQVLLPTNYSEMYKKPHQITIVSV